MWLGAPQLKIKITDLALPLRAGAAKVGLAKVEQIDSAAAPAPASQSRRIREKGRVRVPGLPDVIRSGSPSTSSLPLYLAVVL